MSDYNPEQILALIKRQDWIALAQLERDYLRYHCSLYRPEEIEGIVGSWVSRMIIVRRQYEELGKGDEALLHEIQAHWSEQLPIYRRRAERWENPTPAEEKIKEVLHRQERWNK